MALPGRAEKDTASFQAGYQADRRDAFRKPATIVSAIILVALGGLYYNHSIPPDHETRRMQMYRQDSMDCFQFAPGERKLGNCSRGRDPRAASRSA